MNFELDAIDERPNYISLTGLKKRGWTDRLIRILLGKPDKYSVNPYYKKAAKVRRYDLRRVYEAETTEMFINKPVRSNTAAKKAVATRRSKLLDHVNSLPIEIELVPADELTKLACEPYTDCQDHGDWYAKIINDPSFIRWVTVSYLREKHTKYDEELISMFGKVGVAEAGKLIRGRVLDKIAEAYPHLKKECNRQKHSFKKQSGNQRPRPSLRWQLNTGMAMDSRWQQSGSNSTGE